MIGRTIGSAASVAQGYAVLPANFVSNGRIRNYCNGDAEKSATPVGYLHPTAWILPQKSGGLASKAGRVSGAGDLESTGNLGRDIDAALTGSSTVSAQLGLIIAAFASLAGAGAVSDSNLSGAISAAAGLSGSAAVSSLLGAISGMVINLTGSADAACDISATGSMSAGITVTGELLTTSNVAASVWDALAASFNDPNTIGEIMNNIGASSNPWSALLDDNNDPGTFGERVQKLLTVAKYLGLK